MRKLAPIQVNQFTGGLNTEANPLNYPLEVTADERNMLLNRDGSRKKRLGFDLEEGYTVVNSGVYLELDKPLATSFFRWENAGGVTEQSLLVVQVGQHLAMYDGNATSISASPIYSKTFDPSVYSTKFSYAVVDGLLVVANGLKNIYIYEYAAGAVTETVDTLLVRDQFGVEATIAGVTLTASQNIEVRPGSLNDAHTYNLRNQGFTIPRRNGNAETLTDPIAAFYSASSSTAYPSNCDSVSLALYADANDADNRLVERFFASNLFQNPPGSVPAAQGYFIIDALERGASRLSQEAALRARHPTLGNPVVSLPLDKTPGGPSVLTEYAGRIWYAGFSGEVEGGDPKSPRMSSYVLFSLLVTDKTDIALCYQSADPTSASDPEIVDTDGGFIRIDGAFQIRRMVALQNSLFVFADNGVWRITGAEDTQFSATGYQVNKITTRGCESPDSVVVIDNAILYWSRDGIYAISIDETGDWQAQNLTQTTIQSFYLDIPLSRRQKSVGYFDSYERTVKWVYTWVEENLGYSEELLLHLEFQAFTYNRVATPVGLNRYIVAVNETSPFTPTEQEFAVTVGADVVTVGGVDVFVEGETLTGSVSESLYLVITSKTPTLQYSFGTYRLPTFYDWGDSAQQTNYDAYLTTGAVTTGESESRKQIPFVYTFFKRTENGFNPDFTPANPSSCLLSARYDWHNTNAGSKWPPARQAYRYSRNYIPVDINDDFDTGEDMIMTRNRLRGFGRAIALRFESEAGKNLHLYGWSFNLVASSKDE